MGVTGAFHAVSHVFRKRTLKLSAVITHWADRQRPLRDRSRRSRQELWPAAFGRSAPELLLRTYSKTFGMTLPGLNKPFGSSACLIERISESSTSDLYCRISATRYWPIPCSALKVPPSSVATP